MTRHIRFGLAAVASLAGLTFSVHAQTPDPATAWISLDQVPPAVEQAEPFIRAKHGLPLALDRDAMTRLLAKAPMELGPDANKPVEVIIPTPDGRQARFAALESPVMEEPLRQAYPQIRTYWARGIDDPYAIARFDLTPLGFRAQVLAPDDSWTGGTYYIDPYTKGDDIVHTSYYRKDYAPEREPFQCLTEDAGMHAGQPGGQGGAGGTRSNWAARSAAERRTYRIAVACTGEFGAFYGSAASALSAITTMVNRISGIYDQDFAIRLTLVANESAIIYTNAATDPFTNSGSASATNATLQTTLDSVIGSANYDVGHVVHNGANNGLAGGIGTVCTAGQKGAGYTSVTPPTGDVLAVDYCAHELGHQFNGRHTFNNCGGFGDSAGLAYEPGSGVTIMGYAGICGTNNIALHSDPDFHAMNIDTIIAYTTSGGAGYACPTKTVTGNTAPSVTVTTRTYNIPRSTPFTLTASATDINGDPLTYDWDQVDGSVSSWAIPMTGAEATGPMLKSYPASTSPTRTFPRLSDLVNNTLSAGEVLPSVARTLNFRCVVRDNLGGVSDTAGTGSPTEIQVITAAAAGPFAVTSPNTAVTWSGPRTITWNVAGTTAAPVSCANVKITLSTDGGLTYPTVLAASVPNTGTANVTLPNISTSTARVRVEAVGNIFFDISNSNFTINAVPPGVSLTGTGVNTFTDTGGNGNANSAIDPGESAINVNVQATNNGATTATGVTGTLSSLTPTVSIVTPTASYANIALGATASNATPYVISVSPSHACGTPISLRLTINSAQGSGTYDFTLATGTLGSPTTTTFTYSTPVVAIPDNNATGATATLSIAGVANPITKVVFRFNGSSCNATAGSTTVGLDHTYLADLAITLQSPTGTVVPLMTNRGGSGNNLCNTVFDDSAASPISSVTAASNPYTGTFTPESPLSAFNGQSANGVWSLKVVDNASVDTGNIRNFSILITSAGARTCSPPAAGCPCVADFDNSGGTPDVADVDAFFAAWLAGLPSADSDCSGGTPDVGDIDVFFAQWLAGGC